MNNPFRNNNPGSVHIHQNESHDKGFNSGKSHRAGRFDRGGGGRGRGRGGGGRGRGGGDGRGRGGGGRGRGGNGPKQINGSEYAHGGGKTDYAQKEKEWGKVKFNPVGTSAIEEPSTPWKKFKSEIVQSKADAATSSLNSQAETPAAKEFRKKQDENYRRTQILEKQKEPTRWESFGNDEKVVNKEKTKNKIQKKKQQQKIKTVKPFIANEILENFNSDNLTSDQRNHLRRVITKTTIMIKDETLEHAVDNMKKVMEGRNKRKATL